jgi:hypothetical protein
VFFLGVEMGISGGKERSWSFGVLVLIDFMFFADFFFCSFTPLVLPAGELMWF